MNNFQDFVYGSYDPETDTQKSLFRLRIEWLLAEAEYFVRSYFCRRRGHDLVDAGSYGGPEGGADHYECRRCGQDFSHTYY